MLSRAQREQEERSPETSNKGLEVDGQAQSFGSNSARLEELAVQMPKAKIERVNLPTPVPPNGDMGYYIDRNLDFVARYLNDPAPPTYYIDYGDFYIRLFSSETKDLLTPDGQAWLARARVNLQVAIEDERKAGPFEFDTLEKDEAGFLSFAMGTHADAYWSAGLGDLDAFDLAHIAVTPRAKDLLSLDGLSQTADIGARLVGLWGESAVDYALGQGSTDELVNAVYQGYGLVGDGIDEVFGQGAMSTLENYGAMLGVEAKELGVDAYNVAASVIEGAGAAIDNSLGEGTVKAGLETARQATQSAITHAESAFKWASSVLSDLF